MNRDDDTHDDAILGLIAFIFALSLTAVFFAFKLAWWWHKFLMAEIATHVDGPQPPTRLALASTSGVVVPVWDTADTRGACMDLARSV